MTFQYLEIKSAVAGSVSPITLRTAGYQTQEEETASTNPKPPAQLFLLGQEAGTLNSSSPLFSLLFLDFSTQAGDLK